jgi:putative addiction module CopG family antidote
MKEFVDGRIEAGGYQTVSEYIRDLIRKDIELQAKERNDRLDALLLEGLRSIEEEGTLEITDQYWDEMKARIAAKRVRTL